MLSHFTAYNHVVLVLSSSVEAAVRCMAKQERAAPVLLDFDGVPSVSVNRTGEYRIDGLEEHTQYYVYCVAEDAFGQVMMNSIASTETDCMTPFSGDAHVA